MSDAIIRFKNYRCFEDVEPLIIDLAPGFTALIGKNNSGKSSFLKSIIELRELWGYYRNPQSFESKAARSRPGINPQQTYDPIEIFCNLNDRPLSIEIEIPFSDTTSRFYVEHLKLKTDGRNPHKWYEEFSIAHWEAEIPDSLHVINQEKDMLKLGNFELNVTDIVETMSDLGSCLYVGPFRNAINEGAASYYDLDVGSAFINNWNNWKVGVSKTQNSAIDSITEDIRKLFGFDQLEISASADLKTLQVTINRKPYKLRELGAGIAQFIIVFGNAAIKRPSYILVDEPETNLHPALQVDFLTSLASYARKGVIFATHSIGLARTIADQIYSFSLVDGRSIVKPFEQTPNYAEFLGELSFSAYQDMGFDRILFVEGVSDVRTVQQFLRKIHRDHEIVVLPLGGDQLAKGGVEIELGELRRLSKNISVLVDSEREGVGQPAKQERVDFIDSCAKLGFDVCLTERRALENYFTEGAIQNAFNGTKLKALKPYEKLRDAAVGWAKRDSWKIARNMKWDDIKDTDIGQFLASL